MGVGCHFLLQGIFLTQGLNLHLLLPALAGSLPLYYLESPKTAYVVLVFLFDSTGLDGRTDFKRKIIKKEEFRKFIASA